VVQDIFLTETAEFADVILPAGSFMEKTGTYTNTDRRVQIGRPALAAPGAARQDWELICEIGNRMGFPMKYASIEAVFDEFAACTKEYRTLSYDNLGAYGKWYPCPDPKTSPGERIVFGDSFPLGKAKLVPARISAPNEMPDDAYPFVLNTGRVLQHWHTGSMTRRSHALDAIEPEAFVEIHPLDAAKLKLRDGDWSQVESRRGEIQLRVRVRDRMSPGAVFIPMHFREAAANVLTDPAIDPIGKIPTFKFCAVRIKRIDAPPNTAAS